LGSPLKQVHKYPLINYLFLGLIGACSTLSFSPFNIKLSIFFSLIVLIYSLVNTTNFIEAFKRSFAWGLGYWISGTGWLIVSVYFYGKTHITISIFIIILMGILLSIVFITPISLIKLFNLNKNIFILSIVFASFLTILELSRFVLLGGFPWLLPGLIILDTLGQFLIPIIGVYGLSFIIYFLSAFIALSFFYKKSIYLFSAILCLLIILPQEKIQQEYSGENMEIGIIQPSLDPFEKFQKEETTNIEQTLLDLSAEHMNAELIIWPESPLPYLNSSPEMRSLLIKLDNAPIIISGAWEYQNNELFNSLTILGTNQSYFKRHLVPFGEYVPFERIVRGLIYFFDLPMSSTSAGMSKQELFNIEGFSVLGMICFDVAFPLSFLDEAKNADFIINVSNDTWFGSSYGPYQHLQIVRARALEANRWILRGTSDGISTIVDNKGTIVEIITKGIRGSISGKVYKINEPSFFHKIGYLIIPTISIFVFLSIVILRFRL
tara:strand:- start:2851 stop:4329 length:1479 start_codon:yes stop_codon:yes gene_type:complete